VVRVNGCPSRGSEDIAFADAGLGRRVSQSTTFVPNQNRNLAQTNLV
jgi:hypothetical protein